MVEYKKNNKLHYPELNLDQLKIYAQEWATELKGKTLERISLYELNIKTRMRKHFKHKADGKRLLPLFALVFEFSDLNHIRESITIERGNLSNLHGVDLRAGAYGPFKDNIDIEFFRDKEYLLGETFKRRVYSQLAPERYQYEWCFVPKKRGTELPDPPYKHTTRNVLYEKKPIVDQPKPKRKLRPNQKHKIACLKIAKELWEKDSSITIAAMGKSNEIKIACDGRIYTEKTIRNWIKTECPDRSPGYRPKKSRISLS